MSAFELWLQTFPQQRRNVQKRLDAYCIQQMLCDNCGHAKAHSKQEQDAKIQHECPQCQAQVCGSCIVYVNGDEQDVHCKNCTFSCQCPDHDAKHRDMPEECERQCACCYAIICEDHCKETTGGDVVCWTCISMS